MLDATDMRIESCGQCPFGQVWADLQQGWCSHPKVPRKLSGGYTVLAESTPADCPLKTKPVLLRHFEDGPQKEN